MTRCGGYFFRRSVDFVDTNVRRGEIYYADLSPVVGSEQGGVRPVLIVQNDTGNRHSPTVIAAAITSQTGKAKLPTHIEVAAQCCGLPKDSVILLEQIRTLDKRRLRERMGKVDGTVMQRVDTAIAVSFGPSKTRWDGPQKPRGTKEESRAALAPPPPLVVGIPFAPPRKHPTPSHSETSPQTGRGNPHFLAVDAQVPSSEWEWQRVCC